MILSLLLLPLAAAQDSSASSATPADTMASSGSSFSATPVSTTVPEATVALDSPVPGQDMYPPAQWWCGNETWCPGVVLQDVQLAEVFPDSKTFVDKPTNGTNEQALEAFKSLSSNSSNSANSSNISVTIGQIITFVEANFKGEGLELMQVPIKSPDQDPAFLSNLSDPVWSAWTNRVNHYWDLLIRQTNTSALCQPGPGGCESSLIPLNHTIVVPGGRYREIYYWDSYWILEGLLTSELYWYADDLLENFMDLLDTYGFLPNGGRKYYLNRSQPPVFVQMVDIYVKATGNLTVLERALPLLDAELEWWDTNRTLQVTSPYSGNTHTVAHYAVNNSAPRPEGYVEDYTTVHEAEPALNETQRSDLYAELASGAESGWDYTSRWCREPLLNATDNNPALRTLNVRGIVPVDLTALLAGDHSLLAGLYEQYQGFKQNGTDSGGQNGTDSGGDGNQTTTTMYRRAPGEEGASNMSHSAVVGESTAGMGTYTPGLPSNTLSAIPGEAPTNGSSQSGAPSDTMSAMPVQATGCAGSSGGNGGPGSGVSQSNDTCVQSQPNGIQSPIAAKIAFHRAKAANYTAAVLDLHWDAEKAWWYDFNISAGARTDVYSPAGLWPLWQNLTPPELKQNETLGLGIVSGIRYMLGRYDGVPSPASVLVTGLNWDFPNVWPPHVHTTIRAMERLGHIFPQAQTIANLSVSFDQVAPGQFGVDEANMPPQPSNTRGNATITHGDTSVPWPQALAQITAERYLTAAFCSWYSTGGSLPGVLEPLPLNDLNATGTYQAGTEGVMFGKFNVTDTDAAGGGGEYKVQVGFGWTNGVVLWAAHHYGSNLSTPQCPLIPIIDGDSSNSTATNSTATNATAGGDAMTTSAAPSAGTDAASLANATSSVVAPVPGIFPPNNATEAGMQKRAMFKGYRIPRE